MQIPKSSDRSNNYDISENNDHRASINIPRQSKAKANDLSRFEVSITTSKNTLSGDDMLSNLSFDSHVIINGRNSNVTENEIIMEDASNIRKLSTTQDMNVSTERVICEEMNKAEKNKSDNIK